MSSSLEADLSSNMPQFNPELKTAKVQWSNMVVSKVKDKCNFVFSISNFSYLKKQNAQPVITPSFSFEEDERIKWALKIYPDGSKEDCKGWLSIFLKNKNDSKIEIHYTFGLLDCNNQEVFQTQTYAIGRKTKAFEPNQNYGTPKFIEVQELYNKKDRLLPNDRLSIICSIASVNVDNKYTLCNGNMETSKPQRFFESKIDILNELFKEDIFKDFALLVEGKEIRVHKAILAVHSPVFSAMLQSDMLEVNQHSVIIPDAQYDVVKAMVKFFYTGQLENLPTLAEDLLPIAEKYHISDLKNLCEESLCNDLTVQNVSGLLVVADLYEAKLLRQACMNYIVNHKDLVIRTKDYDILVDKHHKLILETFSLMKPSSDSHADDIDEPLSKRPRRR